MAASKPDNETEVVATIKNHIERDPDELADLIEAVESAGYHVEGPLSNDSLGVTGSDHNRWYWVVHEEGGDGD